MNQNELFWEEVRGDGREALNKGFPKGRHLVSPLGHIAACTNFVLLIF